MKKMKRKNARVKNCTSQIYTDFLSLKIKTASNFQKAIEMTKTAVMRRPNDQHHSINNHFYKSASTAARFKRF